ncbi:P-loop containing nucleoside triphosphate hydrolase protein [Lasiosphaeria miniovina]|uniref:P-loop containing nucleoside triphosphate hydrolase protein n=1 Tax=Lasiosphaeria miniovina TaxID=1954250 RepID=A0AA40AD46_9PEZI|nr:P-loop containing nucleoside triphosphate hydrolase protein [Lasiosphaeria miniovina]KAK0713627.1 P-loop containing nucleoside triphosphate hydrolase protein [Lasiosphaeria miniovina]
MSVRVVARIRPLLEKEHDKDVIVRADSVEHGKPFTMVKIPSPKNEAEEFSFAFNGVYDQSATQEQLFTAEVAPHIKALFQGLDVTLFAYGVTGTGKTHTMRGGLKLAERGVIPRLLSNVFRRGKKIAKDTNGETSVDVALSYYEIYNDKVFDLLEPPEKRTPSGLPLREKDGKTVVVGLSERACEDLKDFERLYIESNMNRVTAATKLNAHSSRSHAILRVKVTQTTGDVVRESTASAIDLAGSEDNRRTENGKERLVESAAINKSLFVLSQCIDAISRGDKRVPYRESKMTRILSLGQNSGITVMILNLAPLRSYHLDTLSSLNVSSRAKRIEVREIENEVVYKQGPRAASANLGSLQGSAARQPLRALANAHNVHTGAVMAAKTAADKPDKPVKAFSVYTDKAAAKPAAVVVAASVLPPSRTAIPTVNSSQLRRSNSTKRPSDSADALSSRPTKLARPTHQSLVRPSQQAQPQPLSMSAEQIEAMVEKKVAEILASRAAAEAVAAAEPAPAAQEPAGAPQQQQSKALEDEVRRRLEALERRIDHDERHDDTRSEGLRHLLQARQAKERGDDAAALRSYELALPFFPGQAKLLGKIDRLRAKLGAAAAGDDFQTATAATPRAERKRTRTRTRRAKTCCNDDEDGNGDGNEDGNGDCYAAASSPGGKHRSADHGDDVYDGTEADVDDDGSFLHPGRGTTKSRKHNQRNTTTTTTTATGTPTATATTNNSTTKKGIDEDPTSSPRAAHLLAIVNSRDLRLIRSLHGFGAKKAQDLVDHLNLLKAEDEGGEVRSLAHLRMLPGMGSRTVERAYEGLSSGGGVGTGV